MNNNNNSNSSNTGRRWGFLMMTMMVTMMMMVMVMASSSSSNLSLDRLLSGEQCFCKLEGRIDDCNCNIDTVDNFNNKKIFPRLQSLLHKDYFRYFQYNPHKKCRFWDMSGAKCTAIGCNVRSCSSEELPPGLVPPPKTPISKPDKPEPCEHDNPVDSTLSDSAKMDLKSWEAHDDAQGRFCDINDENCDDCIYVDLLRNPERFTGYKGRASRQIWKAIYEENCFSPKSESQKAGSYSSAFMADSLQEDLCLEKRAFFRAVSGLHSSITIHLTSVFALNQMEAASKALAQKFAPKFQHGKAATLPFAGAEWYGPNLKEFLTRFDPSLTNQQGPYWLRNLYFVYLLELRALTKAAPFLETHEFYTGNAEEDKDTLIAVKELLNLCKTFPDHFDESVMFSYNPDQAMQLKEEFRQHFLNVTRIMDCVGCDKCRLWGKLQTAGLGTALKILFTDLSTTQLSLSRSEIVALFNAIGRISTSIQQLENFREMLKAQPSNLFSPVPMATTTTSRPDPITAGTPEHKSTTTPRPEL